MALFRTKTDQDEETKSTENRGRTREIVLYTLVIAAFVSSFTLVVFERPAESWPDLIDYIVSNPLTVSIIGALIVFLILDRFRELSKALTEIESRLYDHQGTFNQELENRVDETQRKLSEKWQRIDTKLADISQDYPFLDDINNFDMLVNAPTAIAALKNISILISSGRPNLGYHILYELSVSDKPRTTSFYGSPAQFETLGLFALAYYDDAYLCDLLFQKAGRVASEREIVWTARRLQLATLTGRLSLAVQLSEILSRHIKKRTWESFFLLSQTKYKLAATDLIEVHVALSLSERILGEQSRPFTLFFRQNKTAEIAQGFDEFLGYVHGLSENTPIASEEQVIHAKSPSPTAHALLEIVGSKAAQDSLSGEASLSLLKDHSSLVRHVFSKNTSNETEVDRAITPVPDEALEQIEEELEHQDQSPSIAELVPGYKKWKRENPKPYTNNPNVTVTTSPPKSRRRPKPSFSPNKKSSDDKRQSDE
ncbi:hypothetical protein [uncultured Roseobacter sp.]|uniref:hypothetical protein n=1 Tax=uncultured Roseobacter sp. TaxID=114847 RepID=UPI002638CBD0|nr:hypothetical protein [uncultured Roseobacter sp.]